MFTLTHRRTIGPALAAAVLAVGITAAAAPATAQARANMPNGSGQPWRNPRQPPGVRAGELLAALSTDQKVQLALGSFAALKSFGVPALKADDGPDGVRSPGTTAMPSGQALAATFDRSLASAYGQVVGAEARGEGFNEWLGPAADIDRTLVCAGPVAAASPAGRLSRSALA
jgi:beta-glucosidase